VAVIAGTAQASGVSKTTVFGVAAYVAVLLVNVVPMCGMSWIGRRSDEHNDQREQALSDVREANRRLEAALAENAGLHQQLLTQARETAVFDERQRMAREIHDTLAQGLTGIITQLQAAEQTGHDPARWRRHLEAATGLARESLIGARRSVHELRPEPLETARLSDAISGVAERWSALHRIPVQFTTTGTVRPMSPEAEVALLRAAQEALANVAKHARAARVGVTLSYLEHDVALDVRDDGTGFAPSRSDATDAPPEPVSTGGFGLLAMRQRIEALCGTLQIESELGAGTAVSACVPVPAGVGP
jgi:signal transduction histidine kinase